MAEVTNVGQRVSADPLRAAAVEAEGLVKTYRSRAGTVEAVRGVDLRVEAGEVFGFLGPERRWKVDDGADADDAALDHGRHRACRRASTSRVEPDAVRQRIGVALQEAGLDPRQTGRELLDPPGSTVRPLGARSERRARSSCSSSSSSTDAADRLIKGYSGGMKRRLDLASALVHEPGGAVPRRADDGPRPGEPPDGLGRGAPDQRARHDCVLDDPVPRGGRPALRPAGDHRRRPHRA